MRKLSRQELALFNARFGGMRGSNPGDEESVPDWFPPKDLRTSAEPSERGYWWLAVLFEDNTGGVAGPFETDQEAREAEDEVWMGGKVVRFSHFWISPYSSSREAFLAEFHK